jgi:hypothetical protein
MGAKLKSRVISKLGDEFGIELYNNQLTQVSMRERFYIEDIHATPTITEIRACLPPSLCPQTWRRSSLTPENILDIVVFFNAKYIWQLCLLIGIDVSGSAIKISFSSVHDILIGSKSIALKKLSVSVGNLYAGSKCDIDRMARDPVHQHHIPILPRHVVSDDVLLTLSTLIPMRQSIYIPLTNHGNKSYMWLGQSWLPLKVEGYGIYAARLVLLADFIQAHGDIEPLARRPMVFGDYAVTSEGIVFVSIREITNKRRRVQ